eukprot:618197-Rhodomonas_salina.3
MASGSSIVKPCFPSDELFSSQSPGYLPSYSAPREPKSSTAVEIICRTISVEAADSGQEPGEMDQLKQRLTQLREEAAKENQHRQNIVLRASEVCGGLKKIADSCTR